MGLAPPPPRVLRPWHNLVYFADRRIIDPHHHLWDKHPTREFCRRYMIEELTADTSAGHK